MNMESIFASTAQEKADIGDQTIVNDMIAGAKSAAIAYLFATLEASTPELRSMYSDSLTQVLNAHSSLTKLAIDKGWANPYEEPDQQLAQIFDQSQGLIDNEETRV